MEGSLRGQRGRRVELQFLQLVERKFIVFPAPTWNVFHVHMPIRIRRQLIMILLAGTVALASIAGIIPAATAYRTSVASHLRPIG